MITEYVQLIHKCATETEILLSELIDEKGELTTLGALLITSVSIALSKKNCEIWNT